MRRGDDQTTDERAKLKANAKRASGAKNERFVDRTQMDGYHKKAKDVAGSNERVRKEKEEEAAKLVIDPTAPLDKVLEKIKDPARRAQVQMEIAIAERDQELQQEREVMSLIRERTSVNLCPANTKFGPCKKPLLGKQRLCKTHWAAAIRVSNKLLPQDRDEILAGRKRDRIGSNQTALLDILTAEKNKRPRSSPEEQPLPDELASARAESE